MKESTKILLYGLLASLVLILLCLYTHQDEFKNELKEAKAQPIDKIEKKEEIIKPIVQVEPSKKEAIKTEPIQKVVEKAPLEETVENTPMIESPVEINETKKTVPEQTTEKVEGIEDVLKTKPEVLDIKKVLERNETKEINKTERNLSYSTNHQTTFKKKELVILTAHPKSEKIDKKAEMSDKNLLIKDNMPLIDNEKNDKKKEEESKKDDTQKSDGNISIAMVQEQISKIVHRNISFYKNRAKITNKGKRTLNNVIKILKKLPDAKILVKGYTDASGKANINKWISEERAKSVRKYLGRHGIPLKNIEAKGFGESELLYGNKPYSKLNRRVEIEIKRK